ncbi:MAG: ATP phosphoribosyltransferase regulatory subunit [Eubacteriales bacterium]|nr:ATP phosphoribosyltransferase regulatory subunit [Eubacteriales bacterium]
MEQHNEARQERLVRELRELYESLGYTRFPMRRFEEYALYLENKSFLKSESVLTFTNPDGKLMALKPDVTLSIVKHARPEPGGVEKLYYNESVYRLSATAREFVEIEQMGVEFMGEVDDCAVSEVVRLALESLRRTGEEYVLDVSHMGFAGGLMAAAGLTGESKERLFALIRQKNAHELARAIAEENVPAFYAERITALAGLSGKFEETLARAQQVAVSGEMQQALTELQALHAALSAVGLGDRLRLDFSILNDLDYYNGIVFQGYVQGAPRAVLSGGRYDHLMRRFGKAGDGIGFALYLGELTQLLSDRRELDVDALLLYSPQDDAARVSAAVFALAAQGQRVLAVTHAPAGLRAGKTLRFDGEGFAEVEPC